MDRFEGSENGADLPRQGGGAGQILPEQVNTILIDLSKSDCQVRQQ